MTTPLYQRPQPMVMRVMDATNRGHGGPIRRHPPPTLGTLPEGGKPGGFRDSPECPRDTMFFQNARK